MMHEGKMPHLIIADEAQHAQLMSLVAWACRMLALGDPLQLLLPESKTQVHALLPAGMQLWGSLQT
jgi:hypothetical protein